MRDVARFALTTSSASCDMAYIRGELDATSRVQAAAWHPAATRR